jgi:hypothetical protein
VFLAVATDDDSAFCNSLSLSQVEILFFSIVRRRGGWLEWAGLDWTGLYVR